MRRAEYGRAGNAATLRPKFVSSVGNGSTTFTSPKPRTFRSSAITARRSIMPSAGINTDQMRREAAQHTPTHDAGGQHTHTRTWHGGARCTVAQVRRPFALPLQSTRHGESSGAVLLQPPTGPSYKRRRTQGAPGRRAVAATAPSSFPGRTAAGRRRRSSSAPTGRPTPPELGTRLPIHSSAGAALRAYHLARSLYATVLPTSIHGDHV